MRKKSGLGSLHQQNSQGFQGLQGDNMKSGQLCPCETLHREKCLWPAGQQADGARPTHKNQGGGDDTELTCGCLRRGGYVYPGLHESQV